MIEDEGLGTEAFRAIPPAISGPGKDESGNGRPDAQASEPDSSTLSTGAGPQLSQLMKTSGHLQQLRLLPGTETIEGLWDGTPIILIGAARPVSAERPMAAPNGGSARGDDRQLTTLRVPRAGATDAGGRQKDELLTG
jgi:hypothetical protein